jgi:UDP-N-acetylglucosamine--N-acetylmuramyl-(pentapeptide) pyrophosphoryl-undecaprenol N-acetylglucosamine transferase
MRGEGPVSNPRGTVAIFSGGGTGGHLYPALALLEGVQAIRHDLRPFFLGAQRGLEARVVPEQGLENLLLPVQGFRRASLWGNLEVLAGLFRSLLLTAETFSRLRPGVVVVTGGYAGGPAGLMAGLMGIPLALQEQNARPGITTRVLSRWAAQVHLAYPEARDLLPPRSRSRSRVSGNPIRPPVAETQVEARVALGLDPQARVVLVTGGSQGSVALNEGVMAMVRSLVSGELKCPPDVQLLWVTGPNHLERITQEITALGLPNWVRLKGYLREMPLAMRGATVAVSRAGAMTTSELLAYGIPSILVPLPTSAGDHQARNAESLEAAGAAIHLPEEELTASTLWGSLNGILEDDDLLGAMEGAALKRGRPQATRQIAEAVALLLPSPREVRS